MTDTSEKSSRINTVHQECPQVDRGTVDAILARLDEEYFQKFDPATIARHFGLLAGLSDSKPVSIILEQPRKEIVECTVMAFDHPFEFSSITGMLAGTGFDIERSDAFTLERRKESAARGNRKDQIRRIRSGTTLRRRDPTKDALILDHFRGRLAGPITHFSQWAKTFEPAMSEILALLDQEDPQAIEKAKRLVNERVTTWLKARKKRDPRSAAKLLDPVEASIEQVPGATRLRLRAADAPAFLYALSTALSLHGLQIQRTRIATVNGQAIDEIDLVDSRGKPLLDDSRVQQLRLSVRLTHQFAYFLDQSPDPFTALQRFEELSEKLLQTPQRAEWLALLSDPASMVDLAKVLGASDYLWEDFIRLRAEELLPVFEQHARGQEVGLPSRSVPRRLEEALRGAKQFDQQRAQLNQFKDHELFLIDLDHILSSQSPDVSFQLLSERLVLLAETLVAAAAKLVYAEMVRLYGTPKDEVGHDVPFAIFGLGKLGGVALGFASDIELLFLFGSGGKTGGGFRGAMPNDEFFAIFTRETSDYLQAKREGIFQVDLRLRPFGKGGPLAASREQFARYYSSAGQAHPFERLALVRLRWIAGDAKLGFEIEQLRDQILYEDAAPDLAAIREISNKMRAQHLEGKKLNSKYSPGALTDLESTVQMLQVLHARDVPQLRTPRLNEALESLRRAQILSPAEYEQLMGAYQFLRRLINAQRVLRGSAQDLFIPSKGSDELIHLTRRMNYSADNQRADVVGEILLEDFARHTSAVQQFVKRRLM